MKAFDCMTQPVITATPEMTIVEAAQLLLQHRISGLPVIGGSGSLVGIITEGDLLRRVEIGTDYQYPSWWWPTIGHQRLAGDYIDANARKIGQVMTTSVASVNPQVELTEIVRLMNTLQVKRVPIVDGGRLVGIVSRADFLRILVQNSAQSSGVGSEQVATDSEIRCRIRAEIARQPWAPLAGIKVRVRKGVAELSGTIRDQQERIALITLTENVPGVLSLHDHLRLAPRGEAQADAGHDETDLSDLF